MAETPLNNSVYVKVTQTEEGRIQCDTILNEEVINKYPIICALARGLTYLCSNAPEEVIKAAAKVYDEMEKEQAAEQYDLENMKCPSQAVN